MFLKAIVTAKTALSSPVLEAQMFGSLTLPFLYALMTSHFIICELVHPSAMILKWLLKPFLIIFIFYDVNWFNIVIICNLV